MISLTAEEIAQYRSILREYPEALTALDAIEDCEGDLTDAAISLAIKVGQQPDSNDYLEGLAKRCRVNICQYQDNLLNNQLAKVIGYLIIQKPCPSLLVTPVVFYAVKKGINDFCQPLQFKIEK